MFKVVLDGTQLTDEPKGLADFKEVLQRDENLNGFLLKYPSSLTFSGDGYEILKTSFDNNGYCILLTLEIFGQCSETDNEEVLFTGNIIISDVKFNLSTCIATTTVQDNSYSAKIFNNKNVKANLSATKSKNGIDITPAFQSAIDVFNPTTGTYTGHNRAMVDWFDAFTFLIAFMTDGTVGFASDYLSSFDDDKNFALCTGLKLRDFNSKTIPEISFQELFDNVYKKFPIGFIIEFDSSGNPILRIESEDYFYEQQGDVSFDYAPNLEQSVNTGILYSSLKVGGNQNVNYNSCKHSMVPSSILGFPNSQFYFQTKCNIDKILDLVSTYVIDSNTIEEVIRSGISGELDCNSAAYGVTDTYDDKVFIIQYTKTSQKATLCEIINASPPYQYNQELNNIKVMQRRILQGNATQFFNITGINNNFNSETNGGSEQLISGVVGAEQDLGGWALEISDPNNNYDPTTSTYTAPTDGFYKFDAQVCLINKFFKQVVGGCTKWLDVELSIGYIQNSITTYISGTHYTTDINTCEKVTGEIDHILFKGNFGQGFTNAFANPNFFIELNPVEIYLTASQTIKFFIKTKPLPGVVSAGGSGGVDCSGVAAFSNGDAATNFMSRVNLRINPGFTYPFACGSDVALQDSLKTTVTPDGGGVVVQSTGEKYYSSLLDFNYPIKKVDWDNIKANPLKFYPVNTDGVTNKNGWIGNIERSITTSLAKVTLNTNLNNIL